MRNGQVENDAHRASKGFQYSRSESQNSLCARSDLRITRLMSDSDIRKEPSGAMADVGEKGEPVRGEMAPLLMCPRYTDGIR